MATTKKTNTKKSETKAEKTKSAENKQNKEEVNEIKPKTAHTEEVKPVEIEVRRKTKIAFVASEANPFAGTGGLADVIGSLPKALALTPDFDVRVICRFTARFLKSGEKNLPLKAITTSLLHGEINTAVFSLINIKA